MQPTRVLGECWVQNPSGEIVKFDSSSVLQMLLLYDKVILETPNFHEIEALVSLLGFDGLIGLLESGDLRLVCDPLVVASVPNRGDPVRGPKLPTGHLRFEVVRIFDPKGKPTHISQKLQQIVDISGLPYGDARRLKSLIGTTAVRHGVDSGKMAVQATLRDASASTPVIFAAIEQEMRRRGLASPSERPELSFNLTSEGSISYASNLQKLCSLDARTEHGVVEHALLAVAGLNRRIETMHEFAAVRGLNDGDLHVLDEKIRFLSSLIDPNIQVERLRRVTSALSLPSFDAALDRHELDVKALLRLRQSSEIAEFRRWLGSADSVSDDELRALGSSLKARLGSFVRSDTGKALRFIATTAIGLVPGAGAAIGAAASALDSFLLERLFASPSVVAFLSAQMPSVFASKDGDDS